MRRLTVITVPAVFFPGIFALGLAAYADDARGKAPVMVMPSGGQRVIRLSPDYEYEGALDIRIYPAEGKMEPAADFLITDPAGRKTGRDPRTGAAYSDIPNSFYDYEGLEDAETGDPGPSTGVVDIGNAPKGEYLIEVIGKEPGTYSFGLQGYNKDDSFSGAEFKDIKIQKGEVHAYRMNFSGAPGSKVIVERVNHAGHP